MNVTVKLPEELCRQARYRAVDENKSLSAWLADLLKRSLEQTQNDKGQAKNWCDAFSNEYPDSFYEKELPPEDRKAGTVRVFNFFN